MKFNRGVALGTSLLFVLVSCGGNSTESRTRNGSTGACTSQSLQLAREEFLKEKFTDVQELKATWEAKKSQSDTAFATMRNVQNNVPLGLISIVNRYNSYVTVVEKIEKRNEDARAQGLWDGWTDAEIAANSGLLKYQKQRDTVQIEMNRQLGLRAAELTDVVTKYNTAVAEHDAAFAKYEEASISYNSVVDLANRAECPVIVAAGDAEDFVKEIATESSTTTIARQVFQFFDEPLTEESSTTSTSSTSSSTSSSSTTTPMISTSATIPTEQLPKYATFEIPTFEEAVKALENVLASYEQDKSEELDSKEIQKVVDGINKFMTAVSDMQGNLSLTQRQILELQLNNAINAIASILSKSGSTSIQDSSMSLVASGFASKTAVVVSDGLGNEIVRTTADEDGLVQLTVPNPESGSSNDAGTWLIGGRSEKGKIVVIPFAVSNESSGKPNVGQSEGSGSTSTLPKDPDDTTPSSTIAGTETSSGSQDSSRIQNSWRLYTIVILGAIGVIVAFSRSRRKR